MVKFAKRFFYQVIPEWKDQYIDYRALYRQIKAVKASVLDLAKAYAHIKGTLPSFSFINFNCCLA
jgi:SPX domain protein involved in polyphosphate accumulation